MAEVVREAVDAHIAREPRAMSEVLDETFGSMPDIEVPSRDEWDRGLG